MKAYYETDSYQGWIVSKYLLWISKVAEHWAVTRSWYFDHLNIKWISGSAAYVEIRPTVNEMNSNAEDFKFLVGRMCLE